MDAKKGPQNQEAAEGYCHDHPDVKLTKEQDKNDPDLIHDVCLKCDEEEALEDERQEKRNEVKLKIVELVTLDFNGSMDEHITPHLDILAPSDMADIAVGVMQANCILQLQQYQAIGQPEAFDYLKQRWYLVLIEFIKSMWRKKYEADQVDPDKEAMIAKFEVLQREENEVLGTACATEGCPTPKEDDLDYCLSCQAGLGTT